MTLIKEKHTTKNYYITLAYENNCFIVQVCPLVGEHLCGYPIREMVYTYNEEDKAKRTYKRYIKKYI